MLSELDETAGLLLTPHYYWGACIVCSRKSSPGKAMKRCTRCKCVYYCSHDHQKKHWKEHKPICKYLSTAADNAQLTSFFAGFKSTDKNEWNTFRMNAVISCEILLSAPLSMSEREIFLFPRACRTCFTTKEEMYDCVECYCVSYCSIQHKDQNKLHHQTMCRPLRLAMLADTYESKVGLGMPAIPSEVDKVYMGTAPHISHFLPEPHHSNESEISKEELDYCFLTFQLSGPLTILNTMAKFRSHLTKKKNLEIHIVGAAMFEILGLIKWEYLLHRLPDVETINFHFVGPQLDEEDDEGGENQQKSSYPAVPNCDDCQSKHRSVIYCIHNMRYSHFKKQSEYTEPDVVLVQNAGFSEFQDTEDTVGWTSGWSDLACLAPGKESVMVFTSYTNNEAVEDLKRVHKYCNVKVLASEENPMRSLRPCRDWATDMDKDVFYANQYYTVLEKE